MTHGEMGYCCQSWNQGFEITDSRVRVPMKMEIRILMVEDSTTDAVLMDRELRKGGLAFRSKRIETKEEFLSELGHNRPDVILLDHGLPSFDGFAALELAREKAPDVPVIFVTGSLGEETILKTLKRGANDYVLKHHLPDLVPAVHRALVHAEERRRRRKAEEALQRSEDRYRRLVELCPDAILVESGQKLVFVNSAAKRLLGAASAEELVGKPLHEIFHASSLPWIQERLAGQGLCDESEFFSEQRVVQLDGTVVDVEVAACVLNAEDRSTMQLILHDITDRKRGAEELEARVRQQEMVARLGQRALASCDVNALIQEAVNVLAKTLRVDFCQLLELQPGSGDWKMRAGVGWNASLIGDGILSARAGSLANYTLQSNEPVLFHDLRGETHFQEQRFLLDHGVISGMNVLLRKADQPYAILGVYSCQPRAFKAHDVHCVQAVANILATAMERTQAVEQIQRFNAELEQRVTQRTEQLESANRELEAFSYSVSHDLRAPLRHMDGFVEILRSSIPDAELNEQTRHSLRAISEAARKMGRLIEDLLAFSRMSRAEMNFVPVNVGTAIEKIRGELQCDCQNRDITWVVPALPVVNGDPEMLRLVLTNLIANALKYTRPREQARIEIGTEGTDREIVFFVRDNGVGFDPQYGHKLFGVFQRLHSAREFDGTGIGLAIVRRIVLRHGGRVWAEGVPGNGATFYFSIPQSALI